MLANLILSVVGPPQPAGGDLKGSVLAYDDQESLTGFHCVRHWLRLQKHSKTFFRRTLRSVSFSTEASDTRPQFLYQ